MGFFESFLDHPEEWDVAFRYGRDPSDSTLIHQTLRITSTQDGVLTAPCEGKLSAKAPGGGELDATYPISNLVLDPPVPDKVTLYFKISPAQAVDQRALTDRGAEIGGLLGFVFVDVDTQSIQTALGDALTKSLKDTKLAKKTTLTAAQGLALLLNGVVDISVQAGAKIGQAASNADTPGQRSVGIAAVSRDGLVDPLVTYQVLADLVAPGVTTSLARFSDNGNTGWPVFPNTTDPALVVSDTQVTLFPFAPLRDAQRQLSLDPALWLQIRDNQKELFRRRLLVRSGHAPSGAADPVFEFDVLDWANPFQVEAIAEFYANFTKPWDPDTTPGTPGAPGYTTVDFQNYVGKSATITKQGTKRTVLSFPDSEAGFLATMAADREYGSPNPPGSTSATLRAAGYQNHIELNADSSTVKHYPITTFDPVAKTVTIAGVPNFTGASSWTLHRRMVVVIIDCFGGRLSGTAAQVTDQDVIELDKSISKVNPKWDTIYLSADQGSTWKTYRIASVDSPTTLKVVGRDPDDHPDFGGGTSQWRIPAGLSSSIEALDENLGPNSDDNLTDPPPRRGYDHFDGMLFILKDGLVHHQARWNSFTSRNNSDDPKVGRPFQSSLQGNRRYRTYAIRSNGKDWINFGLSVDNDTTIEGNFVTGALFYFDPLRFDPQNPSPQQPTVTVDGGDANPRHKAGVRIHYSVFSRPGHGCNSAGCLVSPNFVSHTREVFIDLYQSERKDLGLAEDTDVNQLRVGELASKKLYHQKTGGPAWSYKFGGRLWVIRPDEFHEGSQ